MYLTIFLIRQLLLDVRNLLSYSFFRNGYKELLQSAVFPATCQKTKVMSCRVTKKIAALWTFSLTLPDYLLQLKAISLKTSGAKMYKEDKSNSKQCHGQLLSQQLKSISCSCAKCMGIKHQAGLVQLVWHQFKEITWN